MENTEKIINETTEEKLAEAFEKLSIIDCSKYVEKKNGLSYISWAWAWSLLKRSIPDASYKVYERETESGPVNYFTDGKTAWVKVSVTVYGFETVEELPVMDFRNKAIKLESVDSFAVNKTIKRCLVKAIAMATGLGLYIYAGEDLPEVTTINECPAPEEIATVKEPKPASTEVLEKARELMNAKNETFLDLCSEYCKCFGIHKISEIPGEMLEKFINEVN